MPSTFTRLLAALALVPASAFAQMSPAGQIARPAESDAIALGTGGVSGTLAPESWSGTMRQRTVRNVARATLTPVLPPTGKGTGTAVIVAPGGGFLSLSMDTEGWSVAHWLADHGIAAFVLKYRLKPTPAAPDAYGKAVMAMFAGAMKRGKPVDIPATDDAVADGEAALRLVRARAGEWGVDARRVGMLGFSAGAITTLAITSKATPDTMPAFIAPIYGSMQAVAVPAVAPPMFAVLASDDPLFGHDGFGLVEAWQAAHRPVEFHLYQKGGHGFGLGARDTTSTDWIDAFRHWLDMNHLLTPRR